MNKEQLYRYLEHPELLDDRSIEELDSIIKEYPYFQSARLLYIKNLNNQGSIKYDKALKKTAVWITDRRKLFYLLDDRVLLPVNRNGDQGEYSPPTSEADILDFSALSQATPEVERSITVKEEEEDELDKLIKTGSASSGTFFDVEDTVNLEDFKNTFKKKKPAEKQEKPAPKDPAKKRDLLIDKFINEQPKIVPDERKQKEDNEQAKASVQENSDMITDTLAQIYIKQGHYEKAIHAYEKLSLKYPEKNIYFAGQIKKIKQLINNQ